MCMQLIGRPKRTRKLGNGLVPGVVGVHKQGICRVKVRVVWPGLLGGDFRALAALVFLEECPIYIFGSL